MKSRALMLCSIALLAACGGGGGGDDGGSGGVPPAAPTVTLASNLSSAPKNSNITLTWSSTGITSCVASGDWSGTNVAASGSGVRSVGATTGTRTYVLTCTGPNGTATDSVSVTVTEPPLTSDQQLELRRAAGALRSVVDIIMLSARYSRPYIESKYPQNLSTVSCSGGGSAALRALPSGATDAIMSGDFSSCVDSSIVLGNSSNASGVIVTLNGTGVGTWRTPGVISYGDSRFETGQFSVNNGNNAALTATPQPNGTTAYQFTYRPSRPNPSTANRDYCGPARRGVIPDSGCMFLNTNLVGTIDAARTQLRLQTIENSILNVQSNNTFKTMTITAASEVVAPIIADGVFAVHFDDFSQGTFRFERTEAAAHTFVVTVEALSTAMARVTLTETLSGSVVSSTRDMTWSQFFAKPYYDPR